MGPNIRLNGCSIAAHETTTVASETTQTCLGISDFALAPLNYHGATKALIKQTEIVIATLDRMFAVCWWPAPAVSKDRGLLWIGQSRAPSLARAGHEGA